MKSFRIVDYLNSVLPVDQQWTILNVVVPGGNRGSGKVIAKNIFNEGHRVLFTCRSLEKAIIVSTELVQDTGNNKVFCRR